MSDATGWVVGLIALASTGITKKFLSDKPSGKSVWDVFSQPHTGEITPPTSDAGVRPHCPVGSTAKFNTMTDDWQCVPDIWD